MRTSESDRPSTRLVFVLVALTFLAIIGIGASAVGVHAADSAIARANSYQRFHDFHGTHRRWRKGLLASSVLAVMFGTSAALAVRQRRRQRRPAR